MGCDASIGADAGPCSAPTPIPMGGEFLRFVLEGGSHAFVDELVALVREYRLFREH